MKTGNLLSQIGILDKLQCLSQTKNGVREDSLYSELHSNFRVVSLFTCSPGFPFPFRIDHFPLAGCGGNSQVILKIKTISFHSNCFI